MARMFRRSRRRLIGAPRQRPPDPLDEDLFDRRVADLEADDVGAAPERLGEDGLRIAIGGNLGFGVVLTDPGDPDAIELGEPVEPPVGGPDPDDPLAGRALHLTERARQDEAAAVDDGDRVTELLDLVHLVGREDDRSASGVQLKERLFQEVRIDRIETREGLIEEEDLRVMKDRGDDLDLLLVALRELLGPPVGGVGDPEAGEPGPGSVGRFAPRQTEEDTDEGELIEDAHPGIEAALFGQVAPGIPGQLLGGDSPPGDLPVVGPEDVQDDPHRGRLAGAVRAEEAEDPAGRRLEAHRVEGEGRSKTLRDVGKDEAHTTTGSKAQRGGSTVRASVQRR